MSGRQRELARLAGAGWAVEVDSPWRRAAGRLGVAARNAGQLLRAAARVAGRPA